MALLALKNTQNSTIAASRSHPQWTHQSFTLGLGVSEYEQ